MALQHAHAHLVRRQRDRNEEVEVEVETVISVQIVTMPNTYTGKVVWVTQSEEVPKTLVVPATRERTTRTANEDKPKATTKPTATSKKPPSTAESDIEETGTTKAASTLVVATKSNRASSIVGLVSATASASATISATTSATPNAETSDSGMSGGAKAGVVLAILFGIAAFLIGILFLYGRKKKQMAGDKDDEKTAIHDEPHSLPPQVRAAPGAPLTEKSSTWDNNQKSGGNLLTGAAAAVPVAHSQDRGAELERHTSACERPGTTNATTASAKPLDNDQASLNNPIENPFSNNAAINAAQASIPDSPRSTSPLQPSPELANPAPALANTDAMATMQSPASNFPVPPSIKSIADSVPASPAWTEDPPVSPSPALGGLSPGVAVASNLPNGPSAGPNNVHRVQLDFQPSMSDELELRSGSLVRMLHQYDDGWALCINMDRSRQGVVPRTCLSKHPVKPRTGLPRQGPPQGPPPDTGLPMSPGGIPHPQPLSPANGRTSPAPRSPISGPNQMPPPHMQGAPRARSNSNARFNGPLRSMSPGPRQMPSHMQGPPHDRSNSKAPYAGPPRSMSPGPYGGGPQMTPRSMIRPRSNSASQAAANWGPIHASSPMNPNTGSTMSPNSVPGMAI